MTVLLWSIPILAAIAIVLGTCRAETLERIGVESSKSFGRLVVGLTILCVVLQGVLWAIPRLS